MLFMHTHLFPRILRLQDLQGCTEENSQAIPRRGVVARGALRKFVANCATDFAQNCVHFDLYIRARVREFKRIIFISHSYVSEDTVASRECDEHGLLVFQEQLGEPFLETLILFLSSFMYSVKPALKSPQPALKWANPHFTGT